MVLIEDDAEDEAPYSAAAASTSDSDDPDVSRLEEPDASGSRAPLPTGTSPRPVHLAYHALN
eukprot:660093-Amphidinium_carterae.1